MILALGVTWLIAMVVLGAISCFEVDWAVNALIVLALIPVVTGAVYALIYVWLRAFGVVI